MKGITGSVNSWLQHGGGSPSGREVGWLPASGCSPHPALSGCQCWPLSLGGRYGQVIKYCPLLRPSPHGRPWQPWHLWQPGSPWQPGRLRRPLQAFFKTLFGLYGCPQRGTTSCFAIRNQAHTRTAHAPHKALLAVARVRGINGYENMRMQNFEVFEISKILYFEVLRYWNLDNFGVWEISKWMNFWNLQKLKCCDFGHAKFWFFMFAKFQNSWILKFWNCEVLKLKRNRNL